MPRHRGQPAWAPPTRRRRPPCRAVTALSAVPTAPVPSLNLSNLASASLPARPTCPRTAALKRRPRCWPQAASSIGATGDGVHPGDDVCWRRACAVGGATMPEPTPASPPAALPVAPPAVPSAAARQTLRPPARPLRHTGAAGADPPSAAATVGASRRSASRATIPRRRHTRRMGPRPRPRWRCSRRWVRKSPRRRPGTLARHLQLGDERRRAGGCSRRRRRRHSASSTWRASTMIENLVATDSAALSGGALRHLQRRRAARTRGGARASGTAKCGAGASAPRRAHGGRRCACSCVGRAPPPRQARTERGARPRRSGGHVIDLAGLSAGVPRRENRELLRRHRRAPAALPGFAPHALPRQRAAPLSRWVAPAPAAHGPRFMEQVCRARLGQGRPAHAPAAA